jgi:2-iminobutanoate/2-iminopropanoate deaminase
MEENSATHPYSLVRMVGDGTGYVSGVLPYGADGAILTDAADAPRRVLAVLGERLAAVGCSLGDVVKTTVYVTDIEWRDSVNRAWMDAFAPPMPARTLVEVSRLPQDSRIELEAVIHRSSPSPHND